MRSFVVVLVLALGCGRGTPPEEVRGFEPGCYRIPDDAVARALDALEVERLTAEIDVEEARRQARAFGGDVCLDDALVAALAALLRDGRDPTSARAAAALADDEACAIPLCYVDDPRARLVLVGRGREHFGPPPPATVEDRWVFALWVPALSDEIYWATVERTARAGGWVAVRSFGSSRSSR